VTETGGGGSLLARYGLLPREIEEESFRRIEARVRLPFPGPERQVALRMVHAAGDPSLVSHLFFHPRAVAEGVEALRRGAMVWVDVHMVAAGLKPELFPGQVRVLAVVGEQAERFGSTVRFGRVQVLSGGKGEAASRADPSPGVKLTRLARAVLSQGEGFGGSVFACGNSPTALLALLDLLDAGSPPPALVVATCPGFVAAEEAKEELLRRDVPSIAVRGTRGGSPLAAACLNALALLARAGTGVGRRTEEGGERRKQTALLLVGHGSRLSEAAEGLQRVAEEIRARSLFSSVEVGFLQLSPPDALAAASRCVAAGARTVVVLPYFLHSGAHVVEDLPPLLERLRKEHPGVSFHLTPPLGFHPCLVEVVLERAFSALSGDHPRALSSNGGPASGGVSDTGAREEEEGAVGREAGGGRDERLEAKTSGDGKRAPGLHHRFLRCGGGQGSSSSPPGVSPGSSEHSPARRDQGLLLSPGAPPRRGGGGGRGDQGRR